MTKPAVIVTARYEMLAKLLPNLEAALRDVPAGVATCKLLEITHEQVPQPRLGAVEADGGPGRIEQGDGEKPVVADAGKDRELAGRAGKDAGKPLGRRPDARKARTV
jgi:hypothetical protein